MNNKWHKAEIGQYIDLLTGFPFRSSEYTEDEDDIRLLRGDNIIQGLIRWEGVKRWPASKVSELERYQLHEHDLVIAMDRTWVKAGLKVSQISKRDLPSLLVQRVARLRAKGQLDQSYLAQCIASHRFEQYVKGNQTETAVPHISAQQILDFTIPLPSLLVQQNIAAVLRTWDEAITKMNAIARRLGKWQMALYQITFEKQLAAEGKPTRASSVFEPVSERARPDLPLLAVMQDIGVVRRDELDRRVAMPDGDTSSYKVVRPGDFIISLRSFEGGLEYSDVLGLVSPAYTILRPIRQINGDYYRHFFKSRSFIGRLDELIFGIRDGKQIAFRDFGDMRIPTPVLAEQEMTAKLLNEVRRQLQINKQRTATLAAQKRGLMQKLLTGEWRVHNSGGES